MSTVTARPGPVARLQLTEPVRLYLWPVVLILAVGAVAAGIVTQEWADWALPMIGAALGVAGAGEAARSSVYSQASVVQALVQARSAGVSFEDAR